jgi:hypothetical protein
MAALLQNADEMAADLSTCWDVDAALLSNHWPNQRQQDVESAVQCGHTLNTTLITHAIESCDDELAFCRHLARMTEARRQPRSPFGHRKTQLSLDREM